MHQLGLSVSLCYSCIASYIIPLLHINNISLNSHLYKNDYFPVLCSPFPGLPLRSLYRCRPNHGQRVPRWDNSVQARGGTREGCLLWKKENLEPGQVFLPHRLLTHSFCHVAGLMKQVNTERERKQTNESEYGCARVCVCVHRSTEIEEYTHVCVGGRIIMEKRRAVTFFIKTLADDQRRGSYCWKTPSPFPVHTGKRSRIHTQT